MPPKNFTPTKSSQNLISGKEAKSAGIVQDVADETHGFVCDCGFASTNWPTKKAAQERAQQHKNEHETGELMPDVNEFLAARLKDDK